ncbi:MAG TPA: PPK2 family polyphosphate kinase [Acidimicrobiales bacterium]|nr:PPK2 family polyphosphate kinase [Acidimicrobiales bacterium]
MTRTDWLVPRNDGRAHLDADPTATPGAPGDRQRTEAAIPPLLEKLRQLQARLWAEGSRSVLVVLQGLDASGKDGTISHVFRGLNPLGTRVAAFKAPSAEELGHDFLWRVHARCPSAGEIAIFNRSHYEDVLIVRVHGLVAEHVWRRRYAHINAFEALLGDAGTSIVKILLHVSKEEQLERLERRRDDPSKRWKLNEDDFVERSFWDDYVAAFDEMLSMTSTEVAPWHVVPADHKWYRDWAVSTILVDVLTAMDPRYPDEPAVRP